MKILSKEYERYPWHTLLLNTMSQNKLGIERYINILNLDSVSSFEDVQNNMYISVHSLYKEEKLIFNYENQTFTYVKNDKSKNVISNFKAWCRSVSFNYLKKLRKERNQIERNIDIDNQIIRNQISTDAITNHSDFEELKSRIDLLEELDRKIIEMSFFEGYKFKEISKKLEEQDYGTISSNALRMKKMRALRKLRKLFL